MLTLKNNQNKPVLSTFNHKNHSFWVNEGAVLSFFKPTSQENVIVAMQHKHGRSCLLEGMVLLENTGYESSLNLSVGTGKICSAAVFEPMGAQWQH